MEGKAFKKTSNGCWVLPMITICGYVKTNISIHKIASVKHSYSNKLYSCSRFKMKINGISFSEVMYQTVGKSNLFSFHKNMVNLVLLQWNADKMQGILSKRQTHLVLSSLLSDYIVVLSFKHYNNIIYKVIIDTI